jgi:hypothetical protein
MPVSELRKMFNNIAGADRLISKTEFELFLKRFDGYVRVDKDKKYADSGKYIQIHGKFKRTGPRDGKLEGDEIDYASKITGFDFGLWQIPINRIKEDIVRHIYETVKDWRDVDKNIPADQMSFNEFRQLPSVWHRLRIDHGPLWTAPSLKNK